jgi:hypothetical protein
VRVAFERHTELVVVHPQIAVAAARDRFRLKLGHVKPDTGREWQVQARLACRVPNLRSLDVKILVACGICEPEELAQCEALDLLDQVDLFISTSEGQRAIRGGSQPDLDIVTNWIESARHARALKAA